jgi:hypothetical protein
MAPSTRSTDHPSTPDNKEGPGEWSSIQKTRFYDAYDARTLGRSWRSFCAKKKVPESTARYWLYQRSIIGSDAYRKTRQRSKNLGRNFKHPPSLYKKLVNPDQNPVRDQVYEAQIAFHELDIVSRTVQRNLKKFTRQGQRYKQAYV